MHAHARAIMHARRPHAMGAAGAGLLYLNNTQNTYEDQQKMAESLNRRKSIFLSHYPIRVHASSTTSA
jgi:hypothetical protein